MVKLLGLRPKFFDEAERCQLHQILLPVFALLILQVPERPLVFERMDQFDLLVHQNQV